ncbi:uncharacterized protein DS421_1g05080 [Arachis hypogaea]|nr:uncharacterized protein DS421_1g05080 [Arachis hypogaea]
MIRVHAGFSNRVGSNAPFNPAQLPDSSSSLHSSNYARVPADGIVAPLSTFPSTSFNSCVATRPHRAAVRLTLAARRAALLSHRGRSVILLPVIRPSCASTARQCSSPARQCLSRRPSLSLKPLLTALAEENTTPPKPIRAAATFKQNVCQPPPLSPPAVAIVASRRSARSCWLLRFCPHHQASVFEPPLSLSVRAYFPSSLVVTSLPPLPWQLLIF